jgi:hypothetical protein
MMGRGALICGRIAGLGAITGREMVTGRAGLAGILIFGPPPPGLIDFILPMMPPLE